MESCSLRMNQCLCCVCVPGCELNTGEMPAGWRSAGGVYKLQYTHPLCDHSLVTVVTVCMGPVLVINGEFMVQQPSHQHTHSYINTRHFMFSVLYFYSTVTQ